MLSIIRLVLVMVAIVSVTGCTNLQVRTFADGCNGLGGSITLGVFGQGQTRQQCVVDGQVIGVEGQGFRRPPPAQIVHEQMLSSEPLAQWAAGEGGIRHRMGECNAMAGDRWVNNTCVGRNHGSSTTIGGRPVAPPGYIQGGQQGGQGGGGFQPQSFNGNGGGYRNDAAMVGPTGRQWQIVQPGRPVQPGSPYSYGHTNPNGPRFAVDRRIGGVGGGAPYRVY